MRQLRVSFSSIRVIFYYVQDYAIRCLMLLCLGIFVPLEDFLSPLPVKGCRFWPSYTGQSWPSSSDGSLTCHACRDTGHLCTYGHLWGPVALTPVAEGLAGEMWVPDLDNALRLPRSGIRTPNLPLSALTDCTTAAANTAVQFCLNRSYIRIQTLWWGFLKKKSFLRIY